jgi:hypothetical protein
VIKETIKKVGAQKADSNSALAEIEMWRAKSAILSTLH